MTMTPSTPLKIGAVAFGVLWTLWMLWWSGSLDRVNVAMLTICGAMAGYLWYLCMRWAFGRPRFDASGESTEAAQVPRGKIYPWILLSAPMVATRVAPAPRLDTGNPLHPTGAHHRL